MAEWYDFPDELHGIIKGDMDTLLNKEIIDAVRQYVGEREMFDDSPQKEEEYAILLKKGLEEEEARYKKRHPSGVSQE